MDSRRRQAILQAVVFRSQVFHSRFLTKADELAARTANTANLFAYRGYIRDVERVLLRAIEAGDWDEVNRLAAAHVQGDERAQ